ncbi:MAG: hypothetical protein C5B51_19590 [Terriglobia bacterium]|nr:MAG: hypothetical protein C5B51_19590 [Terriglobia bacterium]
MVFTTVLAAFMRWLHIFSVVLLVGGALSGRQALKVINENLAQDSADTLADSIFARYRGRIIAATVLLLISGLYNYFYSTVHHSTTYQVLFVIKLLLAAHVISAGLLAARPKHPRRARLLAGAGLSGLIIIFISNYLSRIS